MRYVDLAKKYPSMREILRKNRKREWNKEKALAVGQQSAKASTHSKDTLNPSYQNGA